MCKRMNKKYKGYIMKKTVKTTKTEVKRTTLDRVHSTAKWTGLFTGVMGGAVKDAVVLPLVGAAKLYDMTPSIKNENYNAVKTTYKTNTKEGFKLQQESRKEATEKMLKYFADKKAKRLAKEAEAKKNTSK